MTNFTKLLNLQFQGFQAEILFLFFLESGWVGVGYKRFFSFFRDSGLVGEGVWVGPLILFFMIGGVRGWGEGFWVGPYFIVSGWVGSWVGLGGFIRIFFRV
jgi:hypothetical protein